MPKGSFRRVHSSQRWFLWSFYDRKIQGYADHVKGSIPWLCFCSCGGMADTFDSKSNAFGYASSTLAGSTFNSLRDGATRQRVGLISQRFPVQIGVPRPASWEDVKFILLDRINEPVVVDYIKNHSLAA